MFRLFNMTLHLQWLKDSEGWGNSSLRHCVHLGRHEEVLTRWLNIHSTLKMAMTRQSTSLGAYPLAWWPPPLVDKTGSIYHRSAGGDEDAFSGLMGIIQTMMGLHLLDVHNSKNTPKWPQYISPTNSRHLSSSNTTTNKFKTFCAARVRGEGRYLLVLGKP